MLIKNVLSHPDDLHDGRTLAPYDTAVVSDEDFQLEHYQARLREGLIAVVAETQPQTVDEIRAAINAAPDEKREAVKASFREAEEASEKPRQGVLDATKTSESEENR